ncbi:hypothetical protein [Nocardioides ferulae]|uniref:hypothetical protein n=1 Tax=Nocardioides ferulae TaxID=2340821 RepID=UPI000F864C1E|nr:hypothetical protein [Nocardioides ferulae]
MAEPADQIHARAVAAGPGGRLPNPDFVTWESFPFEVVDGALVPKVLAAPTDEAPRKGEGGQDCFLCADEVPGVIWTNERWRVKHLERSGLPMVLMLEPIEHLDLPDLDDDLAGELGRITVWLSRIMERLPNVERVHVNRWGDGSAHLHVWFLARPTGLPNLRGTFATLWDDILPPGPEDVWREDLATVARKLATHDGRAQV